MRLFIDQTYCDLATSKITLPKLDLSRLGEVSAHREGRKLRLKLPASRRNDDLFGCARDPETARRFNVDRHTARLEADGAVLMQGEVLLERASDAGYEVLIREGGSSWANQAALRMFNELGLDFQATLTPQAILESWTNDSPVKFFPIHRDSYEQQMSGSDLLTAERLLTVDDYHPFLHIKSLIEQIFRESGYTLQSRFFGSEFFQKLYMSGAYASRDTTAAMNRMGFLARRLTSVTATADSSGRVYANPSALYSTVGNLVESANPTTPDEDGEPDQELYTAGNCFTMNNGRILFRPLSEVSVGFEYYLKYVTEHRILTRHELTGFDTLYIPGCGMVTSHLTNRYVDRREALDNNYIYRLIVFDHTEGTRYRLVWLVDGVPVPASEGVFSSRTTLVTSPVDGTLSTAILQQEVDGQWVTTTLDWALYDGYIREVGKTTVEMRLHSAAERVTPESPKYFDTIFFGGAEEGMTLTLDKHCSIRPLFLSTPGYGSKIDFATVAQHQIRQIELLEAVAHLFNLRFLTDEEQKTVRVEPADVMYLTSPVEDWRSRVVQEEPATMIDLSGDLHEVRTLAYGVSDGAVARLEREEGSRFGAWSTEVESQAALMGEQVRRNPLFHPTLSSVGHYLNAPSARLLQVGDRDSTDEDGTNFSPRIVSYRGLQPLPEGERWGSPAHANYYPLAVFHLPAEGEEPGCTLCFEQRDGVKGLYSHYDHELRCEAEGGLVELTLRLSPHDLESLLRPEGEGATLRSRFRLRTSHGEFVGRLHAIERGVHDSGTVRCTFFRLDR